ncbi:hypothetical protein B9Z55_017208 [Caenorhabditis nigoni]|uniref:Uncharacterized protein n=1 Tax=Caenorhabditis nigoni TaxID=1611254 RepID=A0A2G5T819_9PELO|nr:hypothetical protein B9Z55_017208 [Caenorhabditis nigoni]
MRFFPSFSAVLFIWITLKVVRLSDPNGDDNCLRTVNKLRKEVGVEPLKEEDKKEKARLMKKFPGKKNCPTKDQLENGLDGFTVGRLKHVDKKEVAVPNSVLAPVIKTFVCLNLHCVDEPDVVFFFVKDGNDDAIVSPHQGAFSFFSRFAPITVL